MAATIPERGKVHLVFDREYAQLRTPYQVLLTPRRNRVVASFLRGKTCNVLMQENAAVLTSAEVVEFKLQLETALSVPPGTEPPVLVRQVFTAPMQYRGRLVQQAGLLVHLPDATFVRKAACFPGWSGLAMRSHRAVRGGCRILCAGPAYSASV